MVTLLCTYNSCSFLIYLTIMNEVLQYLISTTDFRLHFSCTDSNVELTGYTDSNWANNKCQLQISKLLSLSVQQQRWLMAVTKATLAWNVDPWSRIYWLWSRPMCGEMAIPAPLRFTHQRFFFTADQLWHSGHTYQYHNWDHKGSPTVHGHLL